MTAGPDGLEENDADEWPHGSNPGLAEFFVRLCRGTPTEQPSDQMVANIPRVAPSRALASVPGAVTLTGMLLSGEYREIAIVSASRREAQRIYQAARAYLEELELDIEVLRVAEAIDAPEENTG